MSLDLEMPAAETQKSALPRQARDSTSRWLARVIALAVALILCMIPPRTLVMQGFDRDKNPGMTLRDALRHLPEGIAGARYDIVYVVGISFPALGAMWLAPRHRRLQAFIFAAYLAVAILSLLASMANVQLVPKIGR